MYAAVNHMAKLVKASSPFKDDDPDSIPLPFHETIDLFRMIEESLWVSAESDASRTPWFCKRPKHTTLIRVLSDPDFEKLRLHRVGNI